MGAISFNWGSWVTPLHGHLQINYGKVAWISFWNEMLVLFKRACFQHLKAIPCRLMYLQGWIFPMKLFLIQIFRTWKFLPQQRRIRRPYLSPEKIEKIILLKIHPVTDTYSVLLRFSWPQRDATHIKLKICIRHCCTLLSSIVPAFANATW